MATYCAQLYTILGSQVYALVPSVQSNVPLSHYAYISHLTGGTIDALILIIGNVDFVHWVKTMIAKFRKRNSTNSQLSGSSLGNNPSSENIEMTTPA
eukprot:Phypoly_transcript_21256.p1 GENE.Phypoly_transcript_21256~~Phypoly_transcript_21256.p1  ORF type:complete len:104 (+),score=0.06 Phypoly_transcript_21256:22-312(+)